MARVVRGQGMCGMSRVAGNPWVADNMHNTQGCRKEYIYVLNLVLKDFTQKILPPIKIGASTYNSLGVDKLLQHQNLRDTEM